MNRSQIAIIGPGKIGKTLYNSLLLRGWPVIAAISRKNSSSRKNNRNTKSINVTEDLKLIEKADTILITVPDTEISTVAKSILKLEISLRKKVFLHFSGALGSNELECLKKGGAYIGSLHPMFSFGKKVIDLPEGILFTFEGDRAAKNISKKICADLRGIFKEIRADQKAAYHLAAVLAGNLTLTLMYEASCIMKIVLNEKNADFREEIVTLTKSMLNNLTNSSWGGAMTGPIQRGDEKIIEMHLSVLKGMKDKELLEIYKLLKKRTQGIINR